MWIDEQERLWSERNRDTWQLPLVSSDGVYLGNVVAQVVEPSQCLVRYFVIFSREEGRRFLIPSDAIQGIDSTLRSLEPVDSLKLLPSYQQHLSKELEFEIHEVLGRIPYWCEH